MELRADSWLPFPRDVVYPAYRDELTKLVPYLLNIKSIEVRERKDEGQAVKLVNIWHGGGDIPSAAKMFLSEKMLSWTDYATWVAPEWHCDWRMETHSMTEAIQISGRNRFFEEKRDGKEGTRLEIRGTLEVDGKKLHGVPKLLAGKAGRIIEEFLVHRIQPNLVSVSDGLRKHLELKAAKG